MTDSAAPTHPSSNRIIPGEVQKGLSTGAPDPFEFLRRNTKPEALTKDAPPPLPPRALTPEVPSFAPDPSPQVDSFVKTLVTEAEKQLVQSTPSVSQDPGGLPQGASAPTPEGSENPPVAPGEEKKENPLLEKLQAKKGPQENMQALRRKADEAERLRVEKEGELTKVQERLTKYEKGEEIPETLKERMATLEGYEKLHALKLSPEFQKTYVEPETELCEKACELARSYGVDPTILDQAAAIEDKKAQNRFLKQHFEDLGAVEVKTVLDQIHDIRAKAAEAELEPAMSLERLQTEYRQAESSRETRRVASITQTAETAWSEALSDIAKSGEYPELTLKGDETHDTAVKKIIAEAAKEFGAYVTDSANNGLRKFDPKLAKIMATRFALSEAGAIIAASRAHHFGRAETTISESQRVSSMLRPPVGARAGGEVLEATPERPKTPEEAGRSLIQQTLAKHGRK